MTLPARKGTWMKTPQAIEGMVFWRYQIYIRVDGEWLVYVGNRNQFEDALLTDDQIAECNQVLDKQMNQLFAPILSALVSGIQA